MTSYCDLAVACIGEMRASVGSVGLSWSLATSVPLLWASSEFRGLGCLVVVTQVTLLPAWGCGARLRAEVVMRAPTFLYLVANP